MVSEPNHESRERAEAARVAAIGRIRAFREHEQLPLTYRATAQNPYKDGAHYVEIYADDQGYEYWVDPADDAIVQVGPGARVHPPARPTRPAARLSVAELRRRAVELAAREMPSFPTRRSSLHPLEDNKDREIYFFRWDDFSQPVKETELPPFLQVGLHADGKLATYTNTLSR